jgi:hypothetical protein
MKTIMKKVKSSSKLEHVKGRNVLAVFLTMLLLSNSCTPEQTEDDIADNENPTIEIQLPLEGAVYSTNFGLPEPSEGILVSALVDDNEIITRVDVNVKNAVTEALTYFDFEIVNNPRGESYDYSAELTEYAGKPNVKILAGQYIVTFVAIDNNGNTGRVSRIITYLDPETDTGGETDN